MTRRVLVVDDDDDVRELVCRMLERMGFTAMAAKGGRQALEQLDQRPPDLVITDLVMPGVDGWAVLSRMRGLPRPPGALAMTGGGRTGQDGRQQARLLGASVVLEKPFSRAEMLKAVQTALPGATNLQERSDA